MPGMMASGIATSWYMLVARLAAVGVATFIVGCGEQAQVPNASDGSPDSGGMGGISGSTGDASDAQAGGGGSGGLVWDASDGPDASDAPGTPDCKCTGSGYAIQINDGTQTLSLVNPFVSPEVGTYTQYCIPPVPAVFTTHAVSLAIDLTACADPNAGPPCLQLTNTSKPSYLDEGSGTVWALSNVMLSAPGTDPPKVGSTVNGTFSATAKLGSATKPVTGTFSVCHAYAIGKPI